MTNDLNLVAAGMVTAVGLDWLSTCAALRGRLDGFEETVFLGPKQVPLVGAPVHLPRPWQGEKRLIHLAAGAIHDLLSQAGAQSADAELVICLAEQDRPGAIHVDVNRLLRLLQEHTGFRPVSDAIVLREGRTAGGIALGHAQNIVQSTGRPVIILGVDSYLNARTITHYTAENRLLCDKVSDGFIPGEGAAAVLLSADGHGVRLSGVGLGQEPAALLNVDAEGYPNAPFRCDGMASAYRSALGAAGSSLDQTGLKMSDHIGESYWFNQSALAMQRVQRIRSPVQPIWGLGSLLGNVGASAMPALLGWALAAKQRGYAPPKPIIIETSRDDGHCAAVVLEAA
ncbi:3-oxoacyl-ACP synthase [Yoonia sediminilitoris]|uniref:3-oxoacyl-[acyl-carrier-protein] synthase-1 n=1 Tax=Yoonia sediminilitoris TaxID=1286148 RepID=A0A2T6KM20_9RHOB|nr:3-oxoacyl-ACP synthase [Yoonia sediminilitoris]PUB17265.1 3-oxoacyl-[acyl-carrier-protein] synthase-1 [Yoonia sediminilitoris]RCW97560.1 3-oxoacyl-[acyl-carrier-protein] synthase-1 [Yoonia sediminilitoris]